MCIPGICVSYEAIFHFHYIFIPVAIDLGIPRTLINNNAQIPHIYTRKGQLGSSTVEAEGV